jgi:hypothetical protein
VTQAFARLPGERLDRRTDPAAAPEPQGPPVGVLALQGDVLEHARALAGVGLRPVPVRTPADLASVEGLVLPGGEETVVVGRMDGRVVEAPRGEHGFGYDPLFVADATDDGRTNAQLAPAEKDAISHRAAAFALLRPLLAEQLGAHGRTDGA